MPEDKADQRVDVCTYSEHDQPEQLVVPESLQRKVESACEAGVSESAIEYVLGALERGALGRRFCVVLSINGPRVWVGETPLHRTDME